MAITKDQEENSAATSRQGSVKPFTIVEGPDAWTPESLEKYDPNYLHVLTEQDIAELDEAVNLALGTGKELKDVTLEDVSRALPSLGGKLVQIRKEAVSGRGFSLLRGVPVERYSRRQQLAAYWILGLHWGHAKPQNKKGHLIGHIKDIGHDPKSPNTRLYATSAAQPWHNDGPADLVALLCLGTAKEGGLSGWSSSVSVHNEILRRDPELVRVLASPTWFFDRKGEIPPGKPPHFCIPVFNYAHGYLSVNYSDNYYILSQRFPDVPRLTPAHQRAMALFNELAASKELALEMQLQVGDVQLLSNHTCLHTRSAFLDWNEEEEEESAAADGGQNKGGKAEGETFGASTRRHLLRLWLSPDDERPLPESYAEIMGGSVEIGKRGGIWLEGSQPNIPLEAE